MAIGGSSPQPGPSCKPALRSNAYCVCTHPRPTLADAEPAPRSRRRWVYKAESLRLCALGIGPAPVLASRCQSTGGGRFSARIGADMSQQRLTDLGEA